MLRDLERQDRLRLLRLACSLAWADLEVRPRERDFVARLARRLGVNAGEAAMVEEWLVVPPPAEDVDPTDVPPEHRALFLKAARAVAGQDGEFSREERESLALLEELLR